MYALRDAEGRYVASARSRTSAYRTSRRANMAGADVIRMSADQGFRSFSAWSELLDYVGRGEPVYYQGPLDNRASRVDAKVLRRKRVPSLVRVSPFGYWPRGRRPFDPFSADVGHLDRFRRPKTDQWAVD